MRLGTTPFAMPAEGGARAEIRALGRTADPPVIAIGPGARIVVQMHEDGLQLLEMLPLENRSDKMFDPGPGAIEIPLPQGFTGAPRRRRASTRSRCGRTTASPCTASSRRRARSSPRTRRESGQEVEFGFSLPYHGDTREILQPMPNGIGAFTLITEQIKGFDITVTGPGVGAREERVLGGHKYWVMPVEGVSAGGTAGVHPPRSAVDGRDRPQRRRGPGARAHRRRVRLRAAPEAGAARRRARRGGAPTTSAPA